MTPSRARAIRKMRRARLALVALGLSSCTTRTTNLATSESPGRDAQASDAAAPDAAPPFTWGDGGVVMCGNHACACNNGVDDDGDGFSDGFDPECTGPFDDDERTFGTGGPAAPVGGPAARCLDCFFDGNKGKDDDCRYPASCAVDGTPTGAGPGCNTCEISDRCVDSCLPRTPNGCDCFGCCEVERPGRESVTIRLQHTCSMDVLDDPMKCPRCVQSPDCYNPCSPCELCPGKRMEGLPPTCEGPDGLPYSCEGGLEACGPGRPCRMGEYCYLGCCLAIVF